MPVKIVTDSVADIPAQVVAELGITVIPVLVRFGEETYRDGIDMTTDQFYEKLVNSKVMPTTSVPSLDLFARTYAKLAEETDEILVIMLSSKLSGLYNAALQSVDLMESECRIEVVDSQCAVMAQGFVVIRAAQAAQAGASLDEILEIVRSNLPRVEMRAAFDTLEYLKRGGRIGKAAALMGSMLKINPLVTIKDGVVEPAGRARSRAKAMDLLYDFVAGYSRIEELAVEGAACPEDVDRLVKRLGALFPEERIYRSRTTPVIGTHTGSGLILVAVMGDK
ncbi:MAG TPA: DegV family protein [Dehalococcoidales bacterium]|nr:DegV family protein [Dehalococcoidales bacterium]